MTAPLWKLTEEAQRLALALEEAEGELDERLEQELDAIYKGLEDKVRGLASVRAQAQDELAALDRWIEMLSNRRARLVRSVASIEKYMARNLGKAGLEISATKPPDIGKALENVEAVLALLPDGPMAKTLRAAVAALMPPDLPPHYFSGKETPGRTVVTAPATSLPDDCITWLPPEPKIDVKAVRRHLDAGEAIEGVSVVKEWRLKVR